MKNPQPKENKRLYLENEQPRGFALIASLILVVLLTLLGTAALRNSDLDNRTSAHQFAATQAFYLAEAGVQRAIRQLRATPDWTDGLTSLEDVFAGSNDLGPGRYMVDLQLDTPQVGMLTIRSTGVTDGFFSATSALEVVGTTGEAGSFPPGLGWGVIVCGNVHFQGNSVNQIQGDTFIGGDFAMQQGNHQLSDGSLSVLRDFTLQDGQVLGDVDANRDIEVQSSAIPAIDGDIDAGRKLTNSGIITGARNDYVSPGPVTNICPPDELAPLVFDSAHIQAFRDSATSVLETLEVENDGLTETGIVHVTSDLTLAGDVVLSGNVVFIVDGNVHLHGPGSLRSAPDGSTATIIVPTGDLHIQGGGDMDVDGTLQVGTVDIEAETVIGGNFHLQGGSHLGLRGSLLVTSGQFHSQGGSTLGVEHQDPVDPNLRVVEATNAGTFIITAWRQNQN